VSSGTLVFDATDLSVGSTSLTSAMASVLRFAVGSDATDPLVMLHDFVTAVTTSTGTFGIQWNASGLAVIDYTP
jgi:multisubunit Na+/H+ antiporter MnhF subunit